MNTPLIKDHELTTSEIATLINVSAPWLVEIGANEGDSTVLFIKEFTSKWMRLDCFECDPRAIAKFRASINDPRVTLYEVALSDKPGTATFHQSGGTPPGECWDNYQGEWDKSGSLKPFDKHKEHSPWMKCGESVIEVQCDTFDAWVSKQSTTRVIDLVWMDVQGAEDLVLTGGQEAFKRVRYIYSEITQPPFYKEQATLHDFDRLLHGFELIGIYPADNFLFENTHLR